MDGIYKYPISDYLLRILSVLMKLIKSLHLCTTPKLLSLIPEEKRIILNSAVFCKLQGIFKIF